MPYEVCSWPLNVVAPRSLRLLDALSMRAHLIHFYPSLRFNQLENPTSMNPEISIKRSTYFYLPAIYLRLNCTSLFLYSIVLDSMSGPPTCVDCKLLA